MLCNLVYSHLPSENCALTWWTVYYCMHQKLNKDIDYMEPWFILSDLNVYLLFFLKNIFDLVQQLWIVLCYDVAFCVIVTDLDYNYHPSLQMTYNLPILTYYNNWNSCRLFVSLIFRVCIMMLTGDQDSGGIDTEISMTRPYCCSDDRW